MSTKVKSIFGVSGNASIAKTPATGTKELLSITIANEKKSAVIFATAPVLGLSIEERADCNITKALNGDFIISSFGDSPAKITITGLSIIHSICKDDASGSVAAFFKANKISTDAKKRITVTIATAPNETATYTCALIGYDTKFSEDYNEYSVTMYTLHLIGVAK